ncbi:LysM peptidoglycan-binding domain-containing protein [Chryseobacterium sp. SN22]|uniref:LysM peptidoglycan-binding domain-containing protein n=1 Tax=Chryseobacterium sp. SN22 TaxID=2606431 RepID=UPI0011EBD600|nr:LysM domain-containing protein [Chryseobacterium sp. SN22]KAA0127813.1 LysM peptidoglycan-binding domain-containing protein [Chryseobacterium sp. SN22]
MEPNRYYVKNGDTLPSIAEELGLSISEIKKYHNESSRPHEWIKEDNSLPVWSTFIIIPDSVEVLKRKKEDFLSSERAALIQKETDTDDYLILQKIDMQVSGGSMIDSETEMMWEFRKFRKDGIFYGEIQQKSHQVKYIKSIYRQFAEYMQKFNKPLEHLVIELSHEGGVESLANQDEIMERWNRLKNELQPEMGNTLEEKNIIEGGDRDFSDTLPLIKNNILYTLFLNDLFYEYVELGTFVEQEKQQYTSQVFANEQVMLLSKRKVEKEGDILKIKFYSEADPGKNGHLRSIYNTKLKDFLQENFDYALTWSLEYHFDIRKGKMLLCHSKIKEQASRKYTHLTEHTIQLSKN